MFQKLHYLNSGVTDLLFSILVYVYALFFKTNGLFRSIVRPVFPVIAMQRFYLKKKYHSY